MTQIRDQRADGQQVLDDTLELARRRANTARPDRANRIGAVAMGVPFLIAVLRYALLVDQGKGSAPEDVTLHDRQMQIMGELWALCLLIGIYT